MAVNGVNNFSTKCLPAAGKFEILAGGYLTRNNRASKPDHKTVLPFCPASAGQRIYAPRY
jgi:hypothetical protein